MVVRTPKDAALYTCVGTLTVHRCSPHEDVVVETAYKRGIYLIYLHGTHTVREGVHEKRDIAAMHGRLSLEPSMKMILQRNINLTLPR